MEVPTISGRRKNKHKTCPPRSAFFPSTHSAIEIVLPAQAHLQREIPLDSSEQRLRIFHVWGLTDDLVGQLNSTGK